MLIHTFLADAVGRSPDAPALLDLRRTVTFAELEQLSNRLAHVLRAGGVHRHDRVVMAIENSVEWVATYFAVLKIGAVAVPLPPGPRSDRLGAALDDCGPAACVVDRTTHGAMAQLGRESTHAVFVWDIGHAPLGTPPPSGGVMLSEAIPQASANPPSVRVIDLDLVAIIYTSGSTGAPRGVMLTHRNLVANASSIVSYLSLTSADRAMCILPFYYVYGLSLLNTHVKVAGSLVIENRSAYPNVVLEGIQQRNVTGFAGVPSTFTLLLERSAIREMEFPSLRYVTQAGGAMPPARVLAWLEHGPKVPFYVMYGATEASARLTYLPPSEIRVKLGSIGRSIPNVEVLVRREDGTVASPGEVGELVARGSNVAAGYWNDPGETAARFGPFGYRTGDLGYADDQGYLFLVGRSHDMIKVGGHRVGPKEIEDVIHEHEAVVEAAVLGYPDSVLEEVPVAFVVSRGADTATSESILQHCRSRLAPHKVPTRLIFVHEVPKIAGIGKIDRRALRGRHPLLSSDR